MFLVNIYGCVGFGGSGGSFFFGRGGIFGLFSGGCGMFLTEIV